MPLLGSDTAAKRGSSLADAERGAALVAAALRSVFLLQLIIGAVGALDATPRPMAYAALTTVVLLISLALITQCVRTGDVRHGRWQIPDMVAGFVSVPILFALVPQDRFVGTWESWALAYAINAAVVAATWLRLPTAVLYAITLTVWTALFSLLAAPEQWRTSLVDCLTIPGYAVVVAVFAHYLRALATAADLSREEAVRATRELELHRYQRTVHDATSILRMLSDDGTPATVLPGLRLQAEREAVRLRNYLDPASSPPSGLAALTVGSMLADALQGFDDLPLELATDLGAEAPMSEMVWQAARGAVATVLHNTRIHAHATQVVVHADAIGSEWEVVISDDGVGFDQSTQRLGFGLASQVHQALADCGAHADVTSAPGHGTSVTLTGPIAQEVPR